MEYTKYAAVGHFKCHRTLDGKKYPVVIVGRKEYMLDVQEMTVWSSLAWRILSYKMNEEAYLKLTRGLSFTSRRTLDDCIDRLVSRGPRRCFKSACCRCCSACRFWLRPSFPHSLATGRF